MFNVSGFGFTVDEEGVFSRIRSLNLAFFYLYLIGLAWRDYYCLILLFGLGSNHCLFEFWGNFVTANACFSGILLMLVFTERGVPGDEKFFLFERDWFGYGLVGWSLRIAFSWRQQFEGWVIHAQLHILHTWAFVTFVDWRGRSCLIPAWDKVPLRHVLQRGRWELWYFSNNWGGVQGLFFETRAFSTDQVIH